MSWIKVCEIGTTEEGKMMQFKSGQYDIIIYKGKGILSAFENRCSHEDYPLIDGYIANGEIECAKHGARFNIQTGEALCMPATIPIKLFKTKIEDNILYVDLP